MTAKLKFLSLIHRSKELNYLSPKSICRIIYHYTANWFTLFGNSDLPQQAIGSSEYD